MKTVETKMQKTQDKPLEFYDIKTNKVEYLGIMPKAEQVVFKSSGVFGNFTVLETVNDYGVSFRRFRRGL